MLAQDLPSLVDATAATDGFSGVVLVAHGDEVLCARAFGLANRSWDIPNAVDTRFRVASISKMFTAVLVQSLIDEGQLGLEDRVLDRLGLPDAPLSPEVRIRHLLTMSAGIADWLEESEDVVAGWDAIRRAHPIYLLREDKDYLPLFLHKAPRAAVGERHAYNNASFNLLGLVIGRLTGQPYAEALRARVLGPAGMEDSGLWAVDEVATRVAEGYMPAADGSWLRNLYSLTPAPAADGGATCTAGDLLRFLRALREGRLLSPEGTRAFLQPRVVDPDDAMENGDRWWYGYGTFFLVDAAGAVIRYGHTGEEDGASGRLWHFPGRDLDVAVLSNHGLAAGSMMQALHRRIVG